MYNDYNQNSQGNQNNSNDSNNFTQTPDTKSDHPIVVQTTSTFKHSPYADTYNNHNNHNNENKPHNKEKHGGMIAVIICCCIVFSSIFGIGGGALVFNYMSNNSEVVSNTTDTPTSNGTIIKQAVDSYENTGTSSNDAIVNAAAIAQDSVVEISTETVVTNSFLGQYVTEGAGSGVIISEDGYIITCAHVIEDATTVTVIMKDGTKYTATVIGSDAQTDIAVLKIESDLKFPAATIGSSSSLLVGEPVLAIGNPLGTLGGSVSNGIISALDREITIDGQSYKLLQTNAAINPGNSGGGLFNIKGELIGVVNAKSSGTVIEGLGFAIPIDDAMKIAEELITNGYISGRPKLGIYIHEVTNSTSTQSILNSQYPELINYIDSIGVYFVEYTENQSGDLQFGDRIVAIDGVPVTTSTDISSILQDYTVGDKVEMTVVRKSSDSGSRYSQGKMVTLDLTLVENMPSQD